MTMHSRKGASVGRAEDGDSRGKAIFGWEAFAKKPTNWCDIERIASTGVQGSKPVWYGDVVTAPKSVT